MHSGNVNFEGVSDSGADLRVPSISRTVREQNRDEIKGQVLAEAKAGGSAVTSIEHDGVASLHSASHGIVFQVLWRNEASPGLYADLTPSCPLSMQGGDLPAK
ncbi:hypothetical protein [Janthinobacterium sp. 61]|uniref:hypothetical protein n=1 Tax=Janthinobacterium sp. 61 TaxID=2035209 RepID=UPI000C6FEF61|nr:hypothetical protein [Janthinobacterium sp. 61]